MSAIRIKQHYGRVLLLADGKLFADMPWQAADDLARALRSVARTAEEWDQAERIALDQALLLRTGAPIGFTDNPRILAEAEKQAAHDRDLRRYLPGGIKSQAAMGRPAVIQHPPEQNR